MSNAFYTKGKEALLKGSVNLATDTIKAALVDLSTYGLAVSGATNAAPIVVTVASATGLANGQLVSISGVAGNTAANGLFKIAGLSGATFQLTDPVTGANVAGSGAYTSGGRAVPLGAHQFFSDLSGVVGTPTAVTGLSVTSAGSVTTFTNSGCTFASVTGNTVGAVVLYKDTGTAATSPLLVFDDTGTGIPVTPNGGNIVYTPNASGVFTWQG